MRNELCIEKFKKILRSHECDAPDEQTFAMVDNIKQLVEVILKYEQKKIKRKKLI